MRDRALTLFKEAWSELKSRFLIIEFSFLVVIISLILIYDDRGGYTRLNGGGVTALGIAVAAWVGLLTFHTLRHSIGLSQQEAASRMDALAPIVVVNFYKDKALRPPFAHLIDLKVSNVGTGPAVDLTVVIQGELLNYEAHAEGFFPQTLAQGHSLRVSAILQGGNEFLPHSMMPRRPEALPKEVTQHVIVPENREAMVKHKVEEERVESIWKAAIRASPNDVLVVTYRDVYSRVYRTTVELIRIYDEPRVVWPHIELGKTTWQPPSK